MHFQGRPTRRQLLQGAAAGAAGLVLGAGRLRVAAQTASAASGVLALSDTLFVISRPGEENVVVRTGRGGVVLVDGGSARGVESLLQQVAALPGGGPAETLFNTHWHPEQTGANETLGRAGRTIIAHENTRLWMTTDVKRPWNDQRIPKAPKAAHPNKTFYDTGTLDDIRYGYIPDAAHTDGDMYVRFPEQNVIVVGDVVSRAGWPLVDWPTGGWIGGLVGASQRLLSMVDEQTRIVPSRGPVLGVEDLKAQYEMFGTVYERVTQMLNKGRGPSEAVAAKPAQEFEAAMGPSDEFVRRSFESLWAYLSPDA